MRSALVLPLLVLLCAPSLAGEPTRYDKLCAFAFEQEMDYEYRRAERLYRRATALADQPFEAVLGMARCAAGVGEGQRARELYRSAYALDPSRPEPWRGMGHFSLSLDRRDEARTWYEKALRLDPEDAPALAGLARLAVEKGEFWEADRLLTLAEASDPKPSFVIGSRAEFYFRSGKMTDSAKTLRRLLELWPNNLGAHGRLSNGFLELDRPYYRPPKVPVGYETEVAKAVAAYRRLDMADAERRFTALDDPEAPDGRPAFFLGLVSLRRGEVRSAIHRFRRSLSREPDSLLFRNALAEAYTLKVARQRPEYGGGRDPEDRLGSLARSLMAPEVPGIERIVRGYARLLPEEAVVVRRTVGPLASYLPALADARVTHDILGFEDRVCDAKEREYLHERRTMDGRWYGGLRGLGGRNAATGIESILAAAELRYNTFAHEFAHQVHRYGLENADKYSLKLMYERAKKLDRCLDYYAAVNVFEYFAQGYEAFVSPVKSPYHYVLSRHTRAELKERDPALYGFLLRITGTEDPDPALRPLARPILAFYEWVGDETALSRALALLGPLLKPEAIPSGK